MIAATNVFYSEVSFTVVEAGTYTIVTDATFDSYAFLYAGFDPEDACAGLLEENDESVLD
ncbi:MAG: hypothetical protein IPL27_08980 [Lewinellaceae bacterium]|nr:hypothetical protein [Lewinellaceae bacterium]